MSLLSKVLDQIAKRIPQKRVTRFDTRTMLNEIASTLDVDRLADILRAAEGGDCSLLFALYRDIILTHSHLQGRFAERKEAVTGDTLNIQPFDKKNPDDVIAATVVEAQIKELQGWETACLHLLDSVIYPVAVVEKVFRAKGSVVDGVMIGYELAELAPVPHDLLDFRDGCVKIKKTDDQGRPTGEIFEADPQRYIIHRGHTLGFPDNWGGPMRSLVFWWLLGTMDREWWSRFLDKYGTPFLVGKYDQADDASRTILERAFSLSTKLGGLAVSKETMIEIMQAAAKDSGDAFHLFHKVANEEISKLILGQTLSSDSKGGSLGDGGATDQAEMRQDKRQSDARRLGGTLRFQLFEDIIRYNGLRGRAPMAIWGSVSNAEMKATADWLQSLSQAGLRVGDDGMDTLSERFGVTIERAPAPAAPAPGGFGGGGGTFPMSVQIHSADGRLDKVDAANQAILRTGGARLAHALGKAYAPLEALIATAATPSEALTRIETYCMTLDPVDAAEIMEGCLTAFAANGSVATKS
jgi:phage gp29-like protein